MTDTAKLKAAALAAGGEEWAPRDQTKNCGEYTVIVKGSLEKHSGWTSCRPVADEVVNKQTMKFIALANPAAVLELIAALEAKDAQIAELEERNAEILRQARSFREAHESASEIIRRMERSKPVVTLPTTRLWAGKVPCFEEEEIISSLVAAGINLEAGGE
ncbi:ead/Ea22-like family protein [Cronobacter sakazakii]|nr:ead/Ea22-like family protein [Cronobacter sakazakii]EJJ0565575.1 ead/Ea22-like family protein [Cronobacter sakazakii]EKK4739806.1 ead/Ea22-like family protein [Cronobacter sakazakii]